MTSQKFSNKSALKYDFKRSIISMLPPSIMLGVLMVINFFAVINGMINYASVDSFADLLKHRTSPMVIFYNDTQFSAALMILCLAFIGFLFASIAFLPFMSKKRANFYFSNPTTRKDIFKNRIVSAVALISGIIFVGVLAIVILNLIVSKQYAFTIGMGIAYYFECLMYILASFAIFSFGFLLSYTVIEGLVFGAGLYAMPTVITIAFDVFYQQLLSTYKRKLIIDELIYFSNGMFNNSSLLNVTSIVNPLFLGSSLEYDSLGINLISRAVYIGESEMNMPSINALIPIIVWAVIIIAFIVSSKHFFVNRKVENTGLHASNKFVNMFVATEVALAVSALSISGISDNKLLEVLLAIVLFIIPIVAFYVASIRKIKIGKKAVAYVGSASVAFALFVAILSTGGLGYDSYIPNADDIEAVAVANEAVSADGSVLLHYSGSIVPHSYNYTGMGIFTDKEDIEKVIGVANELIEKTDDAMRTDVTLVYQLKNGKKVYRAYNNVSAEAKRAVLSLIDTKAYKQTQYDFLTGNLKSNFSKNAYKYGFDECDFFSNSFSYLTSFDTLAERILGLKNMDAFVLKTGSKHIKIENTAELRKAIAEDYKNANYEELYFSNVKPVCFVGFAYDGKTFDEYDEMIEYSGYYIYPSMKNSIAYLNSINAIDVLKEYSDYEKITAVYTANIKDVMAKEDLYESERLFVGGNRVGYDAEFINDMILEDIMHVHTNDNEINDLLANSIPVKHITFDDTLVIVQCYSDDFETVYIPLVMIND